LKCEHVPIKLYELRAYKEQHLFAEYGRVKYVNYIYTHITLRPFQQLSVRKRIKTCHVV